MVQQFLRAAAHERLGTAQVLFKDGSQNKANGNRHDGQLHGTDHNCDQAKVQQAPHIKHAVAAAKCAHTAHAQDDGHQQVLRSRQNLDKTLDAEQHEEQHEQRGQADDEVDGIHQSAALIKDQRARGDTVDDQAAQQDRRDAIAGDTQRQQGNHCTANRCVVCRLRGNHAVHDASTKLFRGLGTVLDRGIGHDAGCTAADTGQDANAGADKCRDKEVDDLALEFLPGETQTMDLIHGGVLNDDFLGLDDFLRHSHDLRHCIQADQNDQLLEAGLHIHTAKVITHDTVKSTDAERGKDDTQQRCCQTFDHIFACQRNDQRQGENGQCAILKCTKLDRDSCQIGRNDHQGDQTKDGTEEREEDAGAQRLCALALARHGRAVKCSDHRSGRAGNIQQNRGDQAAGDAANVQRHQQCNGSVVAHCKSHRQADGNSHRCSQPGDRTKNSADQGACCHQYDAQRITEHHGEAFH